MSTSVTAAATIRRARPARSLSAAVLALLACLVLLVGAAQPASAKSLDEYRADGVIAERYDGYVEVRVSGAPAEARRLVDEINRKRRQVYEKRAAEQNVPVDQVGRVYASQILEKAPPGTYFKEPDGSYVRK